MSTPIAAFIDDVIIKTNKLSAETAPKRGTIEWHETVDQAAIKAIDIALSELSTSDLRSLRACNKTPPSNVCDVMAACLLLVDTNRDDDGSVDTSWAESRRLLQATKVSFGDSWGDNSYALGSDHAYGSFSPVVYSLAAAIPLTRTCRRHAMPARAGTW